MDKKSEQAFEDLLKNLNKINVVPQEVSEIDKKSISEEKIFDSDKNYVKTTLEDLKAGRFKSNTQLRKYLVFWSCLLISIWMWKVGEILVNNHQKYCLSDTVLITLLTTTTANVIGIMLIVLKDLFNGNKEE